MVAAMLLMINAICLFVNIQRESWAFAALSFVACLAMIALLRGG